jgi:hypothetical protein
LPDKSPDAAVDDPGAADETGGGADEIGAATVEAAPAGGELEFEPDPELLHAASRIGTASAMGAARSMDGIDLPLRRAARRRARDGGGAAERISIDTPKPTRHPRG